MHDKPKRDLLKDLVASLRQYTDGCVREPCGSGPAPGRDRVVWVKCATSRERRTDISAVSTVKDDARLRVQTQYACLLTLALPSTPCADGDVVRVKDKVLARL
jgi:hypothetical protein